MAGSCLEDLVYALAAEHFITLCECGRPCRRRRAAVVPTPRPQIRKPRDHTVAFRPPLSATLSFMPSHQLRPDPSRQPVENVFISKMRSIFLDHPYCIDKQKSLVAVLTNNLSTNGANCHPNGSHLAVTRHYGGYKWRGVVLTSRFILLCALGRPDRCRRAAVAKRALEPTAKRRSPLPTQSALSEPSLNLLYSVVKHLCALSIFAVPTPRPQIRKPRDHTVAFRPPLSATLSFMPSHQLRPDPSRQPVENVLISKMRSIFLDHPYCIDKQKPLVAVLTNNLSTNGANCHPNGSHLAVTRYTEAINGGELS